MGFGRKKKKAAIDVTPPSDDEEEDTGLKMEGTDEGIFTSEVDRMFADMKANMGEDTMGDIKMSAIGDEVADSSHFEDDEQEEEEEEEKKPEPEPEPEKKRVPRKKLSKEEKMAKMKAMAKKREEATKEDPEYKLMCHAEEMFNKYDEDKGGTIDSDELKKLCYDMGFVIENDDDLKLIMSLLDTDGDGTVSLEEFQVWWLVNKDSFFVDDFSTSVKAAIFYFRKFDADMSGALDRKEFVLMCKDMKWDAKSTAMTLIALDSDGDGEITFAEFLAWYTKGGLATNILLTYDKDGNGKLSPEEFKPLAAEWKLDPAQADKIFAKFDKDGDGELGLSDLKGLLAKLKQ